MTCPNRAPARAIVAAPRPAWPPLPLLLLLLALLVVAAGCGAATTDTGLEASGSADQAHEAWVAAVRQGDFDAALALADPTLPDPAQFARDAVARMRDYQLNLLSPTGPLEGVSVEPVAGGEGRSVWQFAKKRWCYRAELRAQAGAWYVSRWGQTSTGCR